jgi:hypothetical protein
MAIDFSRLVLGPAMDVFAIPIAWTPTVSQPGQPPYTVNAIWTVKDIDVLMEDGSVLASKSIELGIQYSLFAVPPRKGDGVQITLTEFMIAQMAQVPVGRGFANPANYLIDQVRPDGQGGARIVLKALQP